MHNSTNRGFMSLSEENESTRKRRKIDPPAQFCVECQRLKLSQSFQRAFRFFEKARKGEFTRSPALHGRPGGPLFYEDAFLTHRFKDRLKIESKCPLCSFFRSMRVQPDLHNNYKLLGFCSSESSVFCLPILMDSDIWHKIKHTVFMAVVPDMNTIPPDGHEEHWMEKDIPAVGSVHFVRPGEHDENELLQARELSGSVDFNICREWLSFCMKNHTLCRQRTGLGERITRGFRVINCNVSPPTVESQPWGVPYVALSYVWGKEPSDEVEWPQTVLDAVGSTIEMGFQYLWVDRLCINQKDPDEKSYLISRMTTIYSEADFTIVAAAGTGAGYGLPGVGDAVRIPQHKINLEGGGQLISTHRDPRLDIRESAWWTRGWTYQEGVLSTRRLVFTERQTYWECRGMATQESIRFPLHQVHEPSGQRMADFMLGAIFKGASYSTSGRSGDEDIENESYRPDYGFPVHRAGSIRFESKGLDEHIRAFSARNLSYDGDSLAAFSGILGLYRSNSTLRHILGLPIWIGRVAEKWSGAHITFALSISMWYHRRSPNLQMFVSEESRRRTNFPSWTWAGWQGTVAWGVPPQDEHSDLMCNLIEASALDFLWAADIHLRDVARCVELDLQDVKTYKTFESPWSSELRILEIRNALTLKYFHCKPTKKDWSWYRKAGRQGDQNYDGGRTEWDSHWHRLAGRLVCIGTSLPMSMEEWSLRHTKGELISILVFIGRDPGSGHGRSRFITVRRIQTVNGVEHWERIGILQLIISAPELAKRRTIHEVLQRVPVHQAGRDFVIE